MLTEVLITALVIKEVMEEPVLDPQDHHLNQNHIIMVQEVILMLNRNQIQMLKLLINLTSKVPNMKIVNNKVLVISLLKLLIMEKSMLMASLLSLMTAQNQIMEMMIQYHSFKLMIKE